MFVRQLAKSLRWSTVIIVTWSYHIVRARYIFGQCFDGAVVMRSVPRSYSLSVGAWALVYAYQFAGLGKALVLGCATT